jgi:hypothetical protein
MESHRCKKHRGEGSPLDPLDPLPPSPAVAATSVYPERSRGAYPEPGRGTCPERDPGEPASQTCEHINGRGHRCRLLPASDSTRCPHHARRHAASQSTDEAIAADLLAGIDDFASAAPVNLFLGNLLTQLARKRIRRRDAMALAYISQLLLNSLAALALDAAASNSTERGPS